MNNDGKERRKAHRVVYETPEFVSVDFKLKLASGKEQKWELSVLDCSERGLRLLVTDIDYDLLKTLKTGDVIEDITFYGESTLIRVDATIKHITKIGRGPYKGQHFIGLESKDIISSCAPAKREKK